MDEKFTLFENIAYLGFFFYFFENLYMIDVQIAIKRAKMYEKSKI